MRTAPLLFAALLFGCGPRSLPTQPDGGEVVPGPPAPTADYVGSWAGMFELGTSCQGGGGTSAFVPSRWVVTSQVDNALVISWQDESGDGDSVLSDDACTPLFATMTADGGEVTPKVCNDGRSITRGLLQREDARNMQAKLWFADTEGGAACVGNEAAGMYR